MEGFVSPTASPFTPATQPTIYLDSATVGNILCPVFLSFIFVSMCNFFREQHQTEVSAMEDKVKWLEQELEKTKKSSNETTMQFQTKVGNVKILFLGSHFSHFNHMKTIKALM